MANANTNTNKVAATVSSQQALLKLFNAVVVTDKNTPRTIKNNVVFHTISNGYICDPRIQITTRLLSDVDDIVGIGGAKLNATFHKSWEKVKSASLEQLVFEQILHYITTYGFESLGIYDERFVYIPAEKLELPAITENIPLVYIRGLTSDEILSEIIKLVSSGIALSEETLSNLMVVIRQENYTPSKLIPVVKNRELLVQLYDLYGLAPEDPVEYLRYLIYKITGESLIIKNKQLIEKIKAGKADVLDNLLGKTPANLSSIFLRYKPLFLALRQLSHRKTFFNRLRKQATFTHKPLPEDYLNCVTAKIKHSTFSEAEFLIKVEGYSVWRKIRLAYALKNRLLNLNSILYKVRNGKGWVTKFKDKYNPWHLDWLQSTLNATLDSIVRSISPNVRNKVVYIPDFVEYALPATEKQFCGNFPANTSVVVPNDLIVGVHWYNTQNTRVDIDLSIIGVDGKIGWDRSYRNTNRTIMFSGDVTNAPRPKGATELFYLKHNSIAPQVLIANYFNYNEKEPVDCQLVVANETPVDFGRNYMINPNNVVCSQNVVVNKRQNIIGLIANNRVYFSTVSVGNSITSTNNINTLRLLDFFYSTRTQTISLRQILEKAGATVINHLPSIVDSFKDFVDLSPSSLNKTTIINLIQGK